MQYERLGYFNHRLLHQRKMLKRLHYFSNVANRDCFVKKNYNDAHLI